MSLLAARVIGWTGTGAFHATRTDRGHRNLQTPVISSIIEEKVILPCVLQVIDRKPKSVVDGRFWKPIIRPTSGAVETENSLINNELRSFRQQVASGHRSRKEVEKEVLTAASNAVEFASR